MKIYLAGAINGKSDDECMSWRARVKSVFWGECLDPMDRDYRGAELGNEKEIVENDKMDIAECDAVFVKYDGPSAGTCMEILFAYMIYKPVHVWDCSGAPLSPWIKYHATTISRNLETALNHLK